MIKTNDTRTFIHYGSNVFDKNKFQPIKNEKYGGIGKPFGGLWACDINTEYGWKELCKDIFPDEPSRTAECFQFQLKDNAKILHLQTPVDFDFLPIKLSEFKEERKHNPYMSELDKFRFVNWEAIRDIGIDAIEYIRTSYGHDVFYSWDIDSLLVLNPDAII